MLSFLKCLGGASASRTRVLVIDDFLPDPLIGAGAPRAFELLRALVAAGVSVSHIPTLVATSRSNGIRRELAGVETHAGGSRAALLKFLRKRHDQFDAIIVSRPHNLALFNEACAADPEIARSAFVVYDSEAVFAEREARQQQVLSAQWSPDENARNIRAEVEQARRADLVIAVNEHDAAHFRNAGYADVRVLGHAVMPAFGDPPHQARPDLLFVGPTYADDTPNTDSVVWFVDLVLPIIRQRLTPDMTLSLVGRSNAPLIARRIGGLIVHHGALRHLDEAYDRARVFVAPTRFSAGVPLKVYDAAAHGVPCVVTPLLAGQLGWQHERELLVAETPEEFARQCGRLFEDAELWERIRTAAFARVMIDCDATRFDRDVASICEAMDIFRRQRSDGASTIQQK